MHVRASFRAHVSLTEDKGKVTRALRNLAGANAVVEEQLGPEGLTLACEGEGLESLERLRSLLRLGRIRDAARPVLMRNSAGGRILVAFNRQAAFAGKVSFSELPGESPLGPIWLEVETDDPLGALDWIAPPFERRGR